MAEVDFDVIVTQIKETFKLLGERLQENPEDYREYVRSLVGQHGESVVLSVPRDMKGTFFWNPTLESEVREHIASFTDDFGSACKLKVNYV